MTSDRIAYSQASRMMAVATPLGEDVLLLTDLRIDERVNALFEIEAAVKSQRDDLTPADLVGANVDFRLHLKDDGTRWWNGFVIRMHEDGQTTRGMRSYAMTVRPRLWLLSQRSDCRIFRSTTTTDIIETLLKEHGISDYQLRVTGKLPTRDYSVQWNETDLDYMLRRMQQDSLFYFFKFEKGKHTLVVSDHPSGYDRAPEETVRFAQGSAAMDHITAWRRTFAFTPGRRAGRDWNFEIMRPPESAETSFARVPGNADHELYEFPGRFLDSSEGEAAMRSRIQATESGFETVEATSTVRSLGAGQTFTPIDTAKPDNVFARQVVTAMRHAAGDPTYETGAGVPSYGNTFTTIPAETPATPHRIQRRPRINGSQIALIAGPPGEEIFTDQYGRVKVWFPWDRRAAKDGSDTCWIRVGQPWAGSQWGHQVIPRIGMEALVSYQEGDPDRPFVTALVPDPTNAVPYVLPDDKTKMVFRSNTYKGHGFNELHFEDFGGREKIYMHGQRDHEIHIERNRAKRVDNNQSESVGMSKSIEVGNNHTEVIGGNMTLMVGPNLFQDLVTQKFPVFTPRIQDLAAGMSEAMGEGNMVIGVGKNKSETVMVSSSEIVGAAKALTVGGGYQLSVGGVMNQSVAVSAWEEIGQTKVTIVGHKYEIVCGKASIVLERDGTITFNGVNIIMESDELIKIKSNKVEIN